VQHREDFCLCQPSLLFRCHRTPRTRLELFFVWYRLLEMINQLRGKMKQNSTADPYHWSNRVMSLLFAIADVTIVP
jgi:hypothetical protein